MKTAVIYYSLEGNTKFVAEKIKERFLADIYELREKKRKVPSKGFMKYIWGGKQVVTKEKPELEEMDFNISNYDTLFIGTPVWAGTYTPAIRSFFNKYKIQGKKIVLFCCHEGGIGQTILNMKKTLIENDIISEFEIVYPLKNEDMSNEKIKKWLDKVKI